MTQNIQSIFDHNIKLLGEIDKAVYYFREQQCDKALGLIANSIDEVKLMIEAVISDREYFNLVNIESMLEMMNGILEAKKNKDFVLLADLLELQMINFLIGVQELIISKEEIVFEEDRYEENRKALTENVIAENAIALSEKLTEPINTAELLKRGYRVEFTSCGHMTLAAENEGIQFYFHTNVKTQSEAFLLAKNWYQKDKSRYLIYGFGMGYHIAELHALAPEAEILVYEADLNVLQLACAFTDVKGLLADGRIALVYDPEFTFLKDRLAALKEEEKFVAHFPSYRNIRSEAGRKLVETAFSWIKVIEHC